MTNIEMKKIGRNAGNNDDFSEHPEKLEGNAAYTHLKKSKPLTLKKFKDLSYSNVLDDEDMIKAVYDALPAVNSNSLYRNGSVYLRYSPMEFLLHEYMPDSPITGKFDDNKLLLQDIIQVMDEYDKASDPDESTIAEYAKALAKSSICYVDDKYDGKENN